MNDLTNKSIQSLIHKKWPEKVVETKQSEKYNLNQGKEIKDRTFKDIISVPRIQELNQARKYYSEVPLLFKFHFFILFYEPAH